MRCVASAGPEVLDHGVDKRAPGAFTATAVGDVEVADPREVILEPGGDEPDRLAVLLGEEERVRVERPLELGSVGVPADVCPRRRAALSDCQRSQSRRSASKSSSVACRIVMRAERGEGR